MQHKHFIVYILIYYTYTLQTMTYMMQDLRIAETLSYSEIWDGAHILEKILDHAARPFSSLNETRRPSLIARSSFG